MSGFRKPEIPRGQQFLFPPRVEDFVGALSHVRLVEEVLRQEAFQKTFRDWASLYDLEAGRPAYSPFHLTAIYVYGAMHGILSSRKLEAACRIRIDFKWLAEGLTPDHSTIANFLKKHADQLDDLFRDVLEVARSMGLLKGEHVSVDGTKLEANASRESVKREAKIKAELEEYERLAREIREKWQENDELEDRLFGDDEEPEVSGPEAARKLEAQRRKMKEALAAIERRRNEASRPSEASDREIGRAHV